MYQHYILVESENNPATDPVVFWLNGGPGASSLFGLFVELGPLLLNDESFATAEYNATGVPSLIRNVYSWAANATIIAINCPAPVGWSFCDPPGPGGGGLSCGSWTDELTAAANFKLVEGIVAHYPERLASMWYITGESYAGVYVPMLADLILDAPAASPARKIRFGGFAVGDGCMGFDVLCGRGHGPWWYLQFMHGHGQAANAVFEDLVQTCGGEDALKRTGAVYPPECQKKLASYYQGLGYTYAYNLYDDCDQRHVFGGAPDAASAARRAQARVAARREGKGYTPAVYGYPCPGPAFNMWLNVSAVQTALGVPPGSIFFNEDNGAGFNYSITASTMLPIYARAITKTTLRVLFYNGDTDPGINSFLTQDILFPFVQSIGVDVVEAWRPWTLDGVQRMGGYVQRFAGGFDFLTIRGAGHMVPEFAPAAAQAFFNAWIFGLPYPSYNPAPPSSSRPRRGRPPVVVETLGEL